MKICLHYRIIKKHSIICLIVILGLFVLFSCKTSTPVKAKIVTINNNCFRKAVGNMFSFADSINDCKYELYYLEKNDELECFVLKSTNIPEVSSKFYQTILLMDTIHNHTVLFLENTVSTACGNGEVFFLKTTANDDDNHGFSVGNDNELYFDGCEDIEWRFTFSGNKIQVTEIKNYMVNLYKWLIYATDTSCIDNPLLYHIEVIEENPSDN